VIGISFDGHYAEQNNRITLTTSQKTARI